MKTMLGLAVIVLSLALAACGNNGDFSGGSGLIETDESVISAETSGRAEEIRFLEGSEVAVGDTLAVIDPSRLQLELASARAAREALAAQLAAARVSVKQARTAENFAKTELERVTSLLETSTATKQQHDKAQFEFDNAAVSREAAEANVRALAAKLDQADADIARLDRSLEDCFPLAPVQGVITEKFVETGELLSPGRAIARVARMDTVWVKVYLPSGDFAAVKLGEKATVSTEAGGSEFDGTVVWTSAEAEFTPKNVQTKESRADLVYAVKVSIPNPDHTLKVGMPVFVTLEP